MKENRYDDPAFFLKYSQMPRSQYGLCAAGEWETLRPMLPDFSRMRVLDLGCGYGWHCIYAAQQGASEVIGVDISGKMLKVAEEKSQGFCNIQYQQIPIEDIDFPAGRFDAVISSLALHYVEDYEEVVRKVNRILKQGGYFVFSVEHPVFTSYGSQDWIYDENGRILHFPVDRYFQEGKRKAIFLGEQVIKHHRTVDTYLEGLLCNGFSLTAVREPQPPDVMLREVEGMRDELRRPMMLLIAAKKIAGRDEQPTPKNH